MAPSPAERQLRRARNGMRYAAGLIRSPVAPTPRELVWQRHSARLWRYRSQERSISPPILIVHSLISKSTVLDLLPGASMVEFLLGEGFDVFMVDWEPAQPADAENTLETYVEDYLPDALAAACEEAGSHEVTLVGYCLGGVLTLLLAAVQPHPPVRNLVTLTTPCDFGELGFMSNVFLEGRLDPEDVIEATGLVPARTMDMGFQMLKPTEDIVQGANVWQHLESDGWLTGFVAMNRWARDQVPLPGALFRQIVDTLIRDNALAGGEVSLSGTEVRLAAIECPVLNVFCRDDELVPPGSAQPLGGLLGSEDVTEQVIDSGHVGLVAGGAAREAQPKIADWIRTRSDARA